MIVINLIVVIIIIIIITIIMIIITSSQSSASRGPCTSAKPPANARAAVVSCARI